jgi:hypothetical protein
LNLPRELRDEIYCAMLPSYTRLRFAAPDWKDNAAGRFFSIQCDMSQYCLTVLAVCQQIRAEANAVLYGTNHFEFSVGHGGGPSPFNTIRALPQSGISHIKACTISVCVYPWTEKKNLSLMRGWMDETCKLLMQGGKLQEIKIEVGPKPPNTAVPLDISKLGLVLEPLERLNGSKSVIVKGLVTDACEPKLKKIVEGDRTRKYKRKAGADGEEEVVLRPKQKRRNEVSFKSYSISIPHSFATVNDKTLCNNSETKSCTIIHLEMLIVVRSVISVHVEHCESTENWIWCATWWSRVEVVSAWIVA